MKYAVIDISSSNTSMIVAEVNDRITEVIFRDRTSLTLQHYMEGRKLSSRGIDKVVVVRAGDEGQVRQPGCGRAVRHLHRGAAPCGEF